MGGGVIGDMGGFCSSTYKRGIDFIQIPTTLLAMVDSSVGGKLGVDFKDLKNQIGVFNNPKSVLIDPEVLQTLPENELKSGFAEVVKHALIADKDLWSKITSTPFANLDWQEIITISVDIKNNIVLSDPLENGERITFWDKLDFTLDGLDPEGQGDQLSWNYDSSLDQTVITVSEESLKRGSEAAGYDADDRISGPGTITIDGEVIIALDSNFKDPTLKDFIKFYFDVYTDQADENGIPLKNSRIQFRAFLLKNI